MPEAPTQHLTRQEISDILADKTVRIDNGGYQSPAATVAVPTLRDYDERHRRDIPQDEPYVVVEFAGGTRQWALPEHLQYRDGQQWKPVTALLEEFRR